MFIRTLMVFVIALTLSCSSPVEKQEPVIYKQDPAKELRYNKLKEEHRQLQIKYWKLQILYESLLRANV